MTKLKLTKIDDDRPVKLTVELTAAVHRDLIAYAEVLGRTAGQSAIEPAKLIGPMLAPLWRRIVPLPSRDEKHRIQRR